MKHFTLLSLLAFVTGCQYTAVVTCEGDDKPHYSDWYEVTDEHILLWYHDFSSKWAEVYDLKKCQVSYAN